MERTETGARPRPDNAAKPRLAVGSRVCQCHGCERYFSGVTPFDKHLIHLDGGQTACLQPGDMRAIGMRQNVHGVWQAGQSKKAALAAERGAVGRGE